MCWFLLLYVIVLIFCAVSILYVCFHIFGYVWVTEWLPIGKIAAQLAHYMFSL